MEVLSLKEFYEKNKNSNLNSYLDYLDGCSQELSSALRVAEEQKFEEKVIEDFRKQISFISALKNLLEVKKTSMILQSVDSLSIEEKKNLIESVSNLLKRKMDDTDNSIKAIEEELKNEREKRISILQRNGIHTSYNMRDAHKFFKELKGPENFFAFMLINRSIDITYSTLINFFSRLFTKKFNYVDEKMFEYMADKLMAYRLIANCSNKKNISFTQRFLQDKKIMEYLSPFYTKDSIQDFFYDLERMEKMDTEFFHGLPESLQIRLCQEGFNGEEYKKLQELYNQSDYKVLMNKNFNEGFSLMESESLISGLEAEKSTLEANYNTLESIQESISKDPSTLVKGLENIIEIPSTESFESLIESGYRILEDIKTRASAIKLSQELLENPIYEPVYETITARNKLRILTILGREKSDEVIDICLEVERKRLQQVNILLQGIKDLYYIQKELRKLEKKQNKRLYFITGKEMKEEPRLRKDFHITALKIFPTLKEKNLLEFDTALCDLFQKKDSHLRMMPINLESVLRRPSILINQIDDLIAQEFTYCGFPSADAAKEYVNAKLKAQRSLLKQLADFTIINHHFDLNITIEQLQQLREVQEFIVHLFEDLSEKRKEERMSDEKKACQEISKDILEKFIVLGIEEQTISKENVKRKQEELIGEIQFLREYLTKCTQIEGDITKEDLEYYEKMFVGIDYFTLDSNEIELQLACANKKR